MIRKCKFIILIMLICLICSACSTIVNPVVSTTTIRYPEYPIELYYDYSISWVIDSISIEDTGDPSIKRVTLEYHSTSNRSLEVDSKRDESIYVNYTVYDENFSEICSDTEELVSKVPGIKFGKEFIIDIGSDYTNNDNLIIGFDFLEF